MIFWVIEFYMNQKMIKTKSTFDLGGFCINFIYYFLLGLMGSMGSGPMERNCQTLGITEEDASDFTRVKNGYRTKIRLFTTNREKRIAINIAYFELSQAIFKTKEKEPELI